MQRTAKGTRRAAPPVAWAVVAMLVVPQARAEDAAAAAVPSAASTVQTGERSSAGIAKKQGATAQPVDAPGAIALARGVTLTATYLGEAAGNPTGGVAQGAAYAGQIYGGLDFDLETLAGLRGGSFHATVVERHGDDLSARFIRNDTSVQEIYGPQKLRLVIFTYQQKLLDGRLDVEVGRAPANAAFLASPLYCFFQSLAACGSPVFILQDSNFTAFAQSGWEGNAKLFLTDHLFVHAGVYEASPLNSAPSQTGFDLTFAKGTGVTIPFEIGYASLPDDTGLPRHLGIGGWVDPSLLADPLLDANGRPAVLSGQPYRMDFGRSGFYARLDQMVWRPDPASPRGLTIFGVALFNATGRVEENHSFELGALQVGTLPGRDRDTIGLFVSERRFSRLFVENIALARGTAGGSPAVPREEVMFELNYGLQVSDAVRLMPNVQYILDPDQQAVPFRTTRIPDAFVVGGRLSVDLTAR